MTPADQEQDLVLRLKQANADGKIDGHDPELGCTWKETVPWIDEKDDDDIDVEHKDGGDGESRASHVDDWVIAPLPENKAADEQEEGIENGEEDEADAPAVEVVVIRPVMPVGIQERHGSVDVLLEVS